MAEDLNIFISWSGPTSLSIARLTAGLLRTASDRFVTFVSDEDIRSGQRWLSVINDQLSRAHAGLIIVTPDNQSRPWLQFESGAIANAVDIPNARVIPVLCGLTPGLIEEGSPLRQFQSRTLTNDGMRGVLADLAGMAGVKTDTVISRAARDLGVLLRQADAALAQIDDHYIPEEKQGAMLEEILTIARSLAVSNRDEPEDLHALDDVAALVRRIEVVLRRHSFVASIGVRALKSGHAVFISHASHPPPEVMRELHELAWSHGEVPIFTERRVEPIKPFSIDASDPEHIKY